MLGFFCTPQSQSYPVSLALNYRRIPARGLGSNAARGLNRAAALFDFFFLGGGVFGVHCLKNIFSL